MGERRDRHVLASWDEIDTVAGTGNSIYSGTVTVETQKLGPSYRMIDTTHGRGTVCDMKHKETGQCQQFSDDDNVWGTGKYTDAQSAAVDASLRCREDLRLLQEHPRP